MKREIDFPVSFLYRAYNILEEKGTSAFRNYVNKIDMPPIDIERVLSAYNYTHNAEYKAKIDELKVKLRRKLDGIG